MTRFRLPDGASHEGRDDDGNETFRVSIPLDEHGFFGRQCPSCDQIFRVSHTDYEALPDTLELWCPYCGHRADHSEFMTEQQRERVMRVALDAGMQIMGGALDGAFKSLARRSRPGDLVQISYRSKPFYPQPLPGIDEERLIRERECLGCGLHYAVFGDHRYCPVCGPMLPKVVALDALAAETARLDVLATLDPTIVASLREQGVFERIFADTVKNVVGIVETLADRIFRDRVANADAVLKGKGNVFQRLDDLAALYKQHLNVDVQTGVQDNWPSLVATWATRHVHTHNDGRVDDRYVRAVPTSDLSLGQRVVVTESHARRAIEDASRLCEVLAASAAT